LDDVGAAAHWRPKTARQVENGYGLWLGHLHRHGNLDPAAEPIARLTEGTLRRYIDELSNRVSSVTIASRVRDLREVLRVMQPGADLKLLSRVLRRLTSRARPSRDKGARVLPVDQIFQGAIAYMDDCRDGVAPSAHIRAARLRNGLIIAFLAVCPVRLGELACMRIGVHLVHDGATYRCRWSGHETKGGRPLEFVLPQFLSTMMDCYIEQHRHQLLGDRDSDRLWISVRRQPMSEHGIYDQVTRTTRRIFGRPLNPHLIRDCAATSIAECLPEQVRIAGRILGHASLETTENYYIHASSIAASRRHGDAINRLREQFAE